MTSLERQDGNMYGNDKEPRYSILTYTWGRWEVANGPHLNVSGTSWKIPAIDAQHFFVDAFLRIIKLMGVVERLEAAWVDVACIDQENHAVKMDEIGRQVGIFANAEGVYLWLSHLTTATLQSSWTEIFVWSGSVSKALGRQLGPEVHGVLQRLKNAITTLLGDPWFSSLWMLQEGILRRDAMLLSREADPIVDEHSASRFIIYLYFLSHALYELRLSLLDPFYAFEEQPDLKQLSDDIIIQIEKAGYTTASFSRNPNVQYTAARHRQTRDQLDLIYGIMSIYDVRVGGAAGGANISPTTPYTLGALEDEFAGAINAASPAIGQLFVHRRRPKANRTWRITQDIRVPEELATTHAIECDPRCRIAATPLGHADVRGRICALSDVFGRWGSPSEESRRGELRETYFSVLVDDYLCEDHAVLRPGVLEPYIHSNAQRVRRAHGLVPALLDVFGRENVSVLLLGQEMDENPIPDQSDDWVLRLNTFGLILVHDGLERRQTRRLEPRWDNFEGQVF
ncbi:hypothetical protein SLS58_008243 [Diplodia intermedia]|uniref:Heterokaryon incompatibility domain-containing protein n=1 Tax=Diplodia intermedia TaxID=856260 RepID=A0ABR3TI03_9PEZI